MSQNSLKHATNKSLLSIVEDPKVKAKKLIESFENLSRKIEKEINGIRKIN